MNYLVIAYSNKECKFQRNFENSMKHWGYNYIVIGNGETWEGYIKLKIKRPLEYFKDNPDIRPDIIVFTDCYDILASGPPDELLEKFISSGADFVIGMENHCGEHCLRLNNESEHFMKYINSGFYMGKYQTVIDLWEEICSYDINDDQICVSMYINKYEYFNIKFDHDQEFVSNVNAVENHFDLSTERPIFKYSEKSSCFVHFPGVGSKMGAKINLYGSKFVWYEQTNFMDIYVCEDKTILGKIILFFLLIFIVIFLCSNLAMAIIFLIFAVFLASILLYFF